MLNAIETRYRNITRAIMWADTGLGTVGILSFCTQNLGIYFASLSGIIGLTLVAGCRWDRLKDMVSQREATEAYWSNVYQQQDMARRAEVERQRLQREQENQRIFAAQRQQSAERQRALQLQMQLDADRQRQERQRAAELKKQQQIAQQIPNSSIIENEKKRNAALANQKENEDVHRYLQGQHGVPVDPLEIYDRRREELWDPMQKIKRRMDPGGFYDDPNPDPRMGPPPLFPRIGR